MNGSSDAQDHSKTFLVVDDHAGFRRVLRDFLPEGRVTECSTGLEALSAYAAGEPDWVLMDIEMSDMDGLTATRQLLERFPNARVILVSHHQPEEFHQLAREIGCHGFVHKSRLEEVRRLIDGSNFPSSPKL